MEQARQTPANSLGVLLTSKQVRERYAVTQRTVERWLLLDDFAFPKPLKFRRKLYWRPADISEWEASRARAATGKAA